MNHGKKGNVFARNDNGFKPVGQSGLDDLTLGVFSSALDSAYFEIEIDAQGTPDTFRWRENGGAWTEDVAITGAAQTLAGANGDQIITFSATTGHTLGDCWAVGNLKDEPCTKNDDQAQITDAAMRVLNPNNPPVFTDSGGARFLRCDYATGTAYFDAEVTTVTVTGANGYVPAAALFAVGYLYDWAFDAKLDLAETTAFQEDWKTYLPGLAGAEGSAEGYLAGRAWFDRILASSEAYFLTKLYTYDPDGDGTGDHFTAWVQFTGFNVAAASDKVVREKIGFTLDGAPGFTLNS
jgi:hypothetical protein